MRPSSRSSISTNPWSSSSPSTRMARWLPRGFARSSSFLRRGKLAAMPLAPLGIRRIEALHYYVRDLERSRRFYTERLDFSEVGASGQALVEGGHQRALVFEAGGCRVVCSTPVGEGGRAHRY